MPPRRATPTRKRSAPPIDLVTSAPTTAEPASAPAPTPERPQRAGKAPSRSTTTTDAQARAKARFSAKPRLTVLDIHPDTLGRLRARFRAQASAPDAALSFNGFVKRWIDGHLDDDDVRLGPVKPDHRPLR